MKVLIMGLPGSGKTTLAKQLREKFKAIHFNADNIRAIFNDWDFSLEGRIRQATRMKSIADTASAGNINVVIDFVNPLNVTQSMFKDYYVIWMDTIKKGRFEDTNNIFEKPTNYDLRITSLDYVLEDFCFLIENKIPKFAVK